MEGEDHYYALASFDVSKPFRIFSSMTSVPSTLETLK